jgi:hypothetical protein
LYGVRVSEHSPNPLRHPCPPSPRIRSTEHVSLFFAYMFAYLTPESTKTGGLENHCTAGSLTCNRLKEKNGCRVNSQESAYCSKTVVAGEVAEWLMAPVLKTGIPERVSGVRIPPSPPDLLRPA